MVNKDEYNDAKMRLYFKRELWARRSYLQNLSFWR